jgi:hypothetical protein
MGCSPVVAAAQTLSIQYSNKLYQPLPAKRLFAEILLSILDMRGAKCSTLGFVVPIGKPRYVKG